MLVTSVNPIDAADESFCILLSRSEGLDSSTRKDFRFRSVREDGQPVEFWIAGWALKPEPITAR